MSLMTLLQLVFGLLGLVAGGELLVRGASKIAASMGISSLVIGLTIVAFGTSSPEMVVSLESSIQGHDDIAVANVVGSNIFNVLFILGASAIISTLTVRSQLVRLDVPVMIVSALLLWTCSRDGVISVLEGSFLTSLLIAYTVYLIKKSRKESKSVKKEFEKEYAENNLSKNNFLLNLLFILLGVGLLILGGNWLVTSSVVIAKSLGISETIIGLTIVAAGTSLPEVATSIIATLKGEKDIAIGNVVGSNIFNILLILGLSSILSGKGLRVSDEMLYFDIPLMLATCIACFPIFLAGFKVTKWDGLMFLMSYLVYLTLIVLKSTEHQFFHPYQSIVKYVVLPILTLSLIGSIIQSVKTLRDQKKA